MAYTRQTWIDFLPPWLEAVELNRIEQGIEDAHNQRISTLNGVPAIIRDTDASVASYPPGVAGKLFIASDFKKIYQSNGTSWVLVAGLRYNDIEGKPTNFPTTWGSVSNKPTLFSPAYHQHPVGEISAGGQLNTTTFLRGDGNWATPEGTGSGTSTPPGVIVDYAGVSIPTGWLLCDGRTISRSSYNALYTALGGAGSVWGQGDGSTTFNIPDFRGRVRIGVGESSPLTLRALGSKGGAETHTLLISEMPAHSHSGVTGNTNPSGNHAHNTYGTQVTTTVSTGNGARITGLGGTGSNNSGNTDNVNPSIIHSHAITSEGGGASHNNMQPWVAVNTMIKT